MKDVRATKVEAALAYNNKEDLSGRLSILGPGFMNNSANRSTTRDL